jgi:hypothetical protein
MKAINCLTKKEHQVHVLRSNYYIKTMYADYEELYVIVLDKIIDELKSGFEYCTYEWNGHLYSSYYTTPSNLIMDRKVPIIPVRRNKIPLQLSLF